MGRLPNKREWSYFLAVWAAMAPFYVYKHAGQLDKPLGATLATVAACFVLTAALMVVRWKCFRRTSKYDSADYERQLVEQQSRRNAARHDAA
jgi:hypothetical protein